jgi:hypothetical protein
VAVPRPALPSTEEYAREAAAAAATCREARRQLAAIVAAARAAGVSYEELARATDLDVAEVRRLVREHRRDPRLARRSRFIEDE